MGHGFLKRKRAAKKANLVDKGGDVLAHAFMHGLDEIERLGAVPDPDTSSVIAGAAETKAAGLRRGRIRRIHLTLNLDTESAKSRTVALAEKHGMSLDQISSRAAVVGLGYMREHGLLTPEEVVTMLEGLRVA